MASDLEIPWLSEDKAEQYADSFRVNIRSFVEANGTLVDLPEFPGVRAWVVLLTTSAVTVRLHIYEERVVDDKPTVCDQCRIIGIALRSRRMRQSYSVTLGLSRAKICC